MDRTLAALLLVTALSFIALGGPSLLFWAQERIYLDSRETGVNYCIRIATDARVENLTLFVPVPVQGGELPPGIEAQGPGAFASGPGIYVLDFYTEGDASFVKISVPELLPAARDRGTNPCTLELADTLGEGLDAASPEEHSFVFRPRTGQMEIPCPGRAGKGAPSRCVSYRSLVYTSYEAADAHLIVSAEIRGWNSWWLLGSHENSYIDRITVIPAHPQGWHAAEGLLEAGIGDLDPFYRPPALGRWDSPPGMRWFNKSLPENPFTRPDT